MVWRVHADHCIFNHLPSSAMALGNVMGLSSR